MMLYMIELVKAFVAAFLGTIAFSLIYHVPTYFYPYCGLIGGLGWVCYKIGVFVGGSVSESAFFPTVLVVCFSRLYAVRKRCPATVFLISGIFPLVPGAGIYWTAYYLVVNDLSRALTKGFETVKVAIAIVLGIVIIFELPQKIFMTKEQRKQLRKQKK